MFQNISRGDSLKKKMALNAPLVDLLIKHIRTRKEACSCLATLSNPKATMGLANFQPNVVHALSVATDEKHALMACKLVGNVAGGAPGMRTRVVEVPGMLDALLGAANRFPDGGVGAVVNSILANLSEVGF